MTGSDARSLLEISTEIPSSVSARSSLLRRETCQETAFLVLASAAMAAISAAAIRAVSAASGVTPEAAAKVASRLDPVRGRDVVKTARRAGDCMPTLAEFDGDGTDILPVHADADAHAIAFLKPPDLQVFALVVKPMTRTPGSPMARSISTPKMWRRRSRSGGRTETELRH